MNNEHVEYDGVSAYISSSDDSSGLVFIAPGALVEHDSTLITSVKDSLSGEGRTVVVADLGDTPHNSDIPNSRDNFVENLRKVIDGYLEENSSTEKGFEIVGHSMGGAAALSVASDYPIISVTALDPMAVDSEIIQEIDCPVNIIISDVRSYRNPGKRMFKELDGNGDQHALYEVETSKDVKSGHIFKGQEDVVAEISRDCSVGEFKPDDVVVSSDFDGPI